MLTRLVTGLAVSLALCAATFGALADAADETLLESASAVLVVQQQQRSFCFISHGCWGGANVPLQASVAKVMGTVAAKRNAQFVIAAGDNFYTKGVTGVDDPRFQTTFENVYSAPSLGNIPFLVALGNHDYRGNVMAQVNYTQRSKRWYLPHPYYERRFAEASLSVTVMDCPLLERCFANRGKARWATRCWDKERQLTWLDETLAQAAADGLAWRVVVCHYPMYANGPHVNHPWLIDLVEPAMKRHGAQLYINADNHYMQVSMKDGIAYVNSGGGGGYKHHLASDRGYKVNKHNVFEVFDMGVVLHCIEGSTMINTVVDVNEKVLHTFTLPAATAAAGATTPVVGLVAGTARPSSVGRSDVLVPKKSTGDHVPASPVAADDSAAAATTWLAATLVLVPLVVGVAIIAWRRAHPTAGKHRFA